MQLIAEKLAKTDKLDRLTCLRADGSRTQTQMPRQGIAPHDLLHYVVESALPLRHGFLGLVAAGADAAYVMELAHGADAARVELEAAQTESVVEALQTQLWAGAYDAEAFEEGVRTACAARGTPLPAGAGAAAGLAMFEAAQALGRQWQALPFHQSLTLEFRGHE
ncbi:hypothetical protein PFX98_06445 [Paucibacter sediminis]|uniref:Uncharacterized protein n=1 Tax=Paucibacter sediminis TaxID=3019553 RepID=A0AA95NDK0_9BURK|nr:hypothetical protein [Paucibacter sp. S2-9]WIT13245.1 hypothetical protein PFX98_06445 [Paucibacter sp. S2-9]